MGKRMKVELAVIEVVMLYQFLEDYEVKLNRDQKMIKSSDLKKHYSLRMKNVETLRRKLKCTLGK